MISPKDIQDAIDHPSPTVQKAIARNRAMQADLRKKYARYIDKKKAKFYAPGATMSMILPTYMEWLRAKMKREGKL